MNALFPAGREGPGKDGGSVRGLGLPSRAAILLVRLYQMTLSKCLPRGVCIYDPTCSQYMIDAIRANGFARGVLLGAWRICRCHPYARGGHDPAPGCGEKRGTDAAA